MIFNVGAGGATDADKIKYGDSNVGATLDNLNESVDELNNSLKGLGVHSSDEQVIGTWFGKPLYRKCCEVTNVNIAEAEIPLNINNIDNIVKIDGTFWIGNYEHCSQLGIIDQNKSNKDVYGCTVAYVQNKFKTIGVWGGYGYEYNIDKISFEVLYTKTID